MSLPKYNTEKSKNDNSSNNKTQKMDITQYIDLISNKLKDKNNAKKAAHILEEWLRKK